MNRITVLGAGMIGSAVALDLQRTGFEVTLVDAREDALSGVAARGPIRTERADLGTPAAVGSVVRDADIVVGALSSGLGLQTLRAVIEAERPYVDISFMAEDALELDALAKRHGVTAVVDCGVAPGVSNLLCGLGVALLDRCESLEIYVGGLPAVRRRPFEYKAGFAPHDVIEEYTRPSRIVEHGKIVVREALGGAELTDFAELGTLEAFDTDGLRSIATTLDVPFMKEKTLRYPGHVELMRVLRHIGLFSKEPISVPGGRVRPLDVTAALLFPKWTFDEGEADVTVMRVIATGTKAGRALRHVWELVDRHDPVTNVRSMSRTTGYSAASMVALLARGLATPPGVVPLEILGMGPGFADAFLAEYADRGCHVTHRTEE